MKINVTDKDMRYHGMGYNDHNFIKNVAPRISTWLLESYTHMPEQPEDLANKLRKIAKIIDEE